MKQKTIAAIIIVFLALLAIVFYFGSHNVPATQPIIEVTTTPPAPSGAKDTTYTIEGQSVKLSGGIARQAAAPGSASMMTIKVFGELTLGDLNGDGQNDAALILTQDGGGSGTFYYLAAAYSSTTGVLGSNTLLLGDRVAPQTLEIRDGLIIANVVTRKQGEPMSVSPSEGVTFYARLKDGILIDVTKEVTASKTRVD